jgi:hypothetical protein
MNRQNLAVCFLLHFRNDGILKEYRRIADAVGYSVPTYLLFHDNAAGSLLAQDENRVHRFSNGDIRALQYRSIAKSIVPGSCHFPLLHFFLKHSDYDYYWLIEYDVRFSGEWRLFFDSFRANNSDFLACNIRKYYQYPKYRWWHSLRQPCNAMPLHKRLKCFSPIYRISNGALSCLHQRHCEGWSGHFEVLGPTLLYHAGFKLEDIGGNGVFTPPERMNRFYTEGQGATVRWRPIFTEVGPKANMLYHPVKVW